MCKKPIIPNVIENRNDYLNKFITNSANAPDVDKTEAELIQARNAKQSKALTHALDIRKFEIDLYWKRATYFWAFIAATFTGYFALSNNSNANSKNLVLVCFLGFLFSMSWYLVNRGSKFWQDNWERHVDYLEDDIIGPLYKIAKNPESCYICKPMQEYPFSVSKINLLLSIAVTIIWLALLTIRLYKIIPTLSITCRFADLSISAGIVFVIAVISFWVFVKCGKSKLPKPSKDGKDVKFVIRDYE